MTPDPSNPKRFRITNKDTRAAFYDIYGYRSTGTKWKDYEDILKSIEEALENGDIEKLFKALNNFLSEQKDLKSINPHSFAEEASYKSVILILFHFAFRENKSIHIGTDHILANKNRPDLILYNNDHPE